MIMNKSSKCTMFLYQSFLFNSNIRNALGANVLELEFTPRGPLLAVSRKPSKCGAQ